MDTPTVLFVTDPECTTSDIKDFTQRLTDIRCHISAIVLDVVGSLPILANGSPPFGPLVFPEQWQDEYQTGADKVAECATCISDVFAQDNIEGDVSTLFCELSLLERQVADHAMFSDYVVLRKGMDLRSPTSDPLLHTLLFDTPVGVVLGAGSATEFLTAKRPFVAWDRSRPAARAIHRALPVLSQAEEVSVAVFDPQARAHGFETEPGADLALWLTRHGCNVTVRQFPSGGHEMADAISAKAKGCGSDLIVMGAYTRSRLRQMMFGGTTNKMIVESNFPLFLSH